MTGDTRQCRFTGHCNSPHLSVLAMLPMHSRAHLGAHAGRDVAREARELVDVSVQQPLAVAHALRTRETRECSAQWRRWLGGGGAAGSTPRADAW